MREPDSIDRLIDRMQGMLSELEGRGDELQHFHATYTRTTMAVRDEIRRGAFVDNAWTEAWDLVFAQLYLGTVQAWTEELT